MGERGRRGRPFDGEPHARRRLKAHTAPEAKTNQASATPAFKPTPTPACAAALIAVPRSWVNGHAETGRNPGV